MKGPSLVGPTSLIALGHPFASSEGRQFPGVPLGINIRNGRLVMFDPWLLRTLGLISSTQLLVLAKLEHGKSALVKMLAVRLYLLSMGYSTMRIVINDYKPENTGSEYGALAKFFESKPFTMRDMRINPFERRLFLNSGDDKNGYELGMLNIAQLLCEYDTTEMDEMQRYALRIAMYGMLSSVGEQAWSPEALARVASSLQDEVIDGYHASLDRKLVTQIKETLMRVEDPEVRRSIEERIEALVRTPHNIQVQEIQDAGIHVGARLDNLLNGPLGGMFGAKNSLYDTLTQRAVNKDWRGMNPAAETLMRMLDTQIKIMAGELNRKDLLPDIEIDDEQHRAMSNLQYARQRAYFTEIARGMKTLHMGVSHTLDSIRPGNTDSESYRLGDKIIRNTGLIIYGRQDAANTAMLREIQRREGISDNDLQTLTILPPHTFGFKLGENEYMQFVRVIATPLELQTLIQSNSAVSEMVNRPSLTSPEDLMAFAEANKIDYLGGQQIGDARG